MRLLTNSSKSKNFNVIIGSITLILLLVLSPPIATADNFIKKVGKKIEKGVKKTGKAIEKGAKKVGKGVEKGAKKVGKELKKTGKAIEKGAKKVGKGVEKGAKKVGKELKKVGKKIEKGVKKTGKAIEKAFRFITDKVLEPVFKFVCKDFFNIPDGECFACWTSEGGEYGEVYACKNGDPNQGIPPSRIGQPKDRYVPTQKELNDFDKWVKSTILTYEELEPWSDGLSRFLPGKKVLGTPIPESIMMNGVTRTMEIRKKDGYGVGHFLAPRAIRGKGVRSIGTRYHGGVDFVTEPGESIFSPIDGTVIRVTNAYSNNNHGLKAIVLEKQWLRI